MTPMVASLFLGLWIAGCAPEPVPIVAAPKPTRPVIIRQTIIRPVVEPEVNPASEAGLAIKAFRTQEKAARASRSYPGATTEQLHEINAAEPAAQAATQAIIDKDGHSTQADQTRAHDAIDRLRKAQQAPMGFGH